jgi:tetratricopeptide (TPR) repeat protein
LRELRGQVDPATEPVLSVILLARACREAGDAAGAEEVLRRAVVAQPGQVVLLSALGRLLERQGRLAEAIECYQAARALRPHLGITLGRTLADAGRAVEGEAVCRDLVRRQPNNPEMHYALGNALAKQGGQGKLAEAVAAFQEAIRLKPDYANAHHNLGLTRYYQGKLAEAVAAYQEAIRLKPDFPMAHNNLGNALYYQRKLAEAVAAYQEAIRLKPDFPMAHFNLGNTLRVQGKSAEAVAAFQEAIRLKADYANAYNNLGLALFDRGTLAEAAAAFQEAIRLKPDLPEAHNNLGSALANQGKLAEAVAAYQTGIRLQPDYPNTYSSLGLLLRDQGRFREALASLRKGHELGARRSGWPSTGSAAIIRRVERLVELDGDLPAFLAGQRQPAGPDEQIELACLCGHPAKRLYVAAAHFFADAFAARPALMDDLEAGHRYSAACAAALAGCGRGEDAGNLSAAERTRWRQQARAWLHADLAVWAKQLARGPAADRALVQKTLTHWRADPDLAGLRDPDALARLPADEQEMYRQLWEEVAALLRKAEPP